MSDREKVIKGLEWILNDIEENGHYQVGYYADEIRKTISLLKEQESVTPFIAGKGKTFEEADTWWYACGNCQQPIDMGDRYCRMCGMAVKWDDT